MALNSNFLKRHKIALLLVLTSMIFYGVFAYNLLRTDYVKLLTLYGALFYLFYKIVGLLKHQTKVLTYVAFGFRAVFIIAIPNLSQDFYRFIWDGRMLVEGFNPYLYNVENFIKSGVFPVAQAQELYNGMGVLNASHYTNYPPISQVCYAISGLFAGKSILGSAVVMRLIIIAADFGTLHFGKKLMEKLEIPSYHIFWYILNPFIIIELTGNLHFEGVMIFFLVWSLYLLHIGKWHWAALVFALSVSVKLMPLIILPLFFQWFTKQNVVANNVKQSVKNDEIATSLPPRNDENKEVSTALNLTKLILFYTIVGVTTLLLFAPFYSSEFINNYTNTVALWFNNFEFNGSLYYLAREIGYVFRNRNEIAIIGAYIPKLVVLFVLIITFLRNNKTTLQLISAMLLVLSFYYFIATTVHPWYIATLLILSVFTKYKFPLVWSFVIIFSYLAYLNVNKEDKSENLWVIALEYIIVYGVFIWEVFIKKASKKEA
ncbi:mannosyltransferase [Litoribaculum gwangyangense]|uniref:DUF2029 domain-containing protein n=1 Tax=Litoribaculum gwangyangense TaxID=1130722 RepID=A0ABP9C7P8_9FLAO